jgi:hypothetical protein
MMRGDLYIGRTFENLSVIDFQKINRTANSQGLMAVVTAINYGDGGKSIDMRLEINPTRDMSETYEDQLEAAKKFVRSVHPTLSEFILERTAEKVVKAIPKTIIKSVKR